MVCIVTEAVVTWHIHFSKLPNCTLKICALLFPTSLTMHFKYVHFVVYKIYASKPLCYLCYYASLPPRNLNSDPNCSPIVLLLWLHQLCATHLLTFSSFFSIYRSCLQHGFLNSIEQKFYLFSSATASSYI